MLLALVVASVRGEGTRDARLRMSAGEATLVGVLCGLRYIYCLLFESKLH